MDLVIYSDLACPWAHIAVFRLHRVRAELGLEGRVGFDHRPFPLEVVNHRPTPYAVLTAEIPVAGALEPDAGWQMWHAAQTTWPVTTLPALEAVQAAKSVLGLAASERLDRALRVALFAESRCISMRHVILDVAKRALGDEQAASLQDSLDTGVGRSATMLPPPEEVKGSPHVFVPDGADYANPGIELHWQGEHGRGFPVVDRDDPAVYKAILTAAEGSAV